MVSEIKGEAGMDAVPEFKRFDHKEKEERHPRMLTPNKTRRRIRVSPGVKKMDPNRKRLRKKESSKSESESKPTL